MRRIISLLLSICLILGACPTKVMASNLSDSKDVSKYIDEFEYMYGVIGGTSTDEVGNHEKWILGEGIQYGNYQGSSSVDDIYIDSSKYSIFNIFVGQTNNKAKNELLKEGWKLQEENTEWQEYKKGNLNIIFHVKNSCISDISFWRNSKEEPEKMYNEGWKKAYIDYINENAKIYDELYDSYRGEYKLVNVNGDEIPELYIDFGIIAYGSVLCSYYDNSVIEQRMYASGFSYIEGENLFIDSGGHMDVYHDKIYCIENEKFVLLAEGEFGAPDNSNIQFDSEGMPIYNYYWNGKQVASESEYQKLLDDVYDKKKSINPYDGAEFDNESGHYVGNGLCDYYGIIEAIENYEGAKIKAYTAYPDSTIGVEQEVKILFQLSVNGNHTPIEEYALGISNPSIIEMTDTQKSEGSQILTVKGLKKGTAELTFTEKSSGAKITIPITVENKCNYFRCSTFPIPYESSGSIYVADYKCTTDNDGMHDITFNAYNTSYAYGVVEVYDEEDTLIKLVPLDPRSDSSGIEKVINGFKYVWLDIKDIFDGGTPFYTKESNAKHTPVTLEDIPENAEIIITSDGNESNFSTLYMGVDTFVRTVCAASTIDLKIDAQAATVKELMSALVNSLIKSISDEETEKTIVQELIKETSENISTAIAFSVSADSIFDVYETVSNLFQNLDINAADIILNVLKGMGYNVADTAFTTVVPQYKIVNFVDQILATAWPLTDYQYNIDRGKMEIHTTKHGMQNFVANSSVTVTQQSDFNNDTVLDAYIVKRDEELEKLPDSINEKMTNYNVYNITLREKGVEIQPDGEIEVRMPVPDSVDRRKCSVYRIEENDELTKLDSTLDNGFLIFKTSHLSYYVIGQGNSKSMLNIVWIVLGVIGVLGGVGVTCIFLKRKKSDCD